MPLSIEALRSNAEFVRQYFRAHPAASIHEAARAAVDAKQGLHLEEISRIRRELLPELRPMGAALARQVAPLTVKPHPPLPQKPRSPVQILKEAVPLQPPPVETAPEAPQAETPPKGEDMATKARTHKTHIAKYEVPLLEVGKDDLELGRKVRAPGAPEVRRRYLNAYLEKHPDSTSDECMRALADTFGVGLAYVYVTETVRLHRAARNAPPVVPPAPAQQAAPPPAPVAPPSPAPVPPAPSQSVQWGPPTVQMPLPACLESELKTLASAFKLLCEAHQLEEASLSWGSQRAVKANYSRTQRATLEV